MAADIKGSLRGVQAGNYLETRFVDSTFRFLCILQGDADLITPLRVLVSFQGIHRLSKVVLDEVEEGAIVLLVHSRVVYDEGTVCDDRSGGLIEGRGKL